jgi:hypothetical protein
LWRGFWFLCLRTSEYFQENSHLKYRSKRTWKLKVCSTYTYLSLRMSPKGWEYSQIQIFEFGVFLRITRSFRRWGQVEH